MNGSYTALAGGRDIYGRPWEVGTRGRVMVVKFGETVRVFDDEPGDSDGGTEDRDRFTGAIGRAAMPGQAVVRAYRCCKCCEQDNAEYGGKCDPQGHLQPCENGCDGPAHAAAAARTTAGEADGG